MVSALFILVPVLLVLIWINGAYHGSRRHEVKPFEEGLAFFECFYFGLESFWHPLDHDELNDNVKLGVYLLVQQGDQADANQTYEYIRSKKGFSKIISKLNSEEYEYVKTGVTDFAVYLESTQDDMLKAINSGSKMQLIQSDQTKKLKLKCFDFGLKNEIEEIEKGYLMASKEFNKLYESNNQNTKQNVPLLVEMINSKHKKSQDQISKNLKKLFKE